MKYIENLVFEFVITFYTFANFQFGFKSTTYIDNDFDLSLSSFLINNFFNVFFCVFIDFIIV